MDEVHDIIQEAMIKTIPKKKKCKKAKWLPGEALQIAVKRREAKSPGGGEGDVRGRVAQSGGHAGTVVAEVVMGLGGGVFV